MDKNDFFFAIGNLIAGALTGVFAYWAIKVKKFFKKQIDLVSDKKLNHNSHIRDLIIEIRANYDADRVLLYQFHNGDFYASGASYKKASITHQAIKKGVAPMSDITAHLSIPITMITPCLKDLEGKEYCVSNVHLADDNCYFKYLLLESGVQKCLISLINNNKGISMGIIFICWLNEIEPAEDLLKEIPGYAKSIAEELVIEGTIAE